MVNLILTLVFVLLFLPKITEAATLFLSPSSGTYPVGSTITVSVRANTAGSATNTAEANLTYSTDTLELVRTTQGTTYYLPAPGSPNRGNGTAYFGGGLPTPGYTGNSGSLGTLTFRARAIGTATVNISNGKVLLNDGFGTNALTSSGSATFTIAAPAPPPVGTPEVTSTTHPDPNGWFANNNLELSWSRPGGAYGFSFELDQNAETIPDNTLDTTVTTKKSYPDLKDGVWYFHIKARGETTGFGNTLHFRVGVDTVAPKPFEINIEGTGEDITANFASTDDLSGIGRYDLYVDSELFKENVSSPFKLTELNSGSANLKIVALDKAGNKSEASAAISIEGRGVFDLLQKPVEVPLYSVLLLNLLLLLIIIVLLYLLLKKKEEKKQVNSDLIDLKDEIDLSLDDLKKDLTKKLEHLKIDNTDQLLEKELALSNEVREEIGDTINKIDNKISKVSKRRSKKQ